MTTDAAAPDSRSDPRPDARAARTTEALRVAILRLAAEQHVDRLSVAQIAAAAGIHRVTFYDHARSPSALLARVMRDELDAVRAEYLAASYLQDHSLAEAIRHTSTAVAALVDSHSTIFEHLLAEHSRTTAHDLLAPHFEASVAALIADRSAGGPTDQPGAGEADAPARPAQAALARAALARYVAYGSVGAMEVWFAGGAGRDPEAYYALIEPLLPRWLVV